MMKNLMKFVAALSVWLPQDIHAEGEAPLPITVQESAYPTSGYDVVFKRETPSLKTGDGLSFLGRYDPTEDRIVFLDPLRIHVALERKPFWQIYFSVETGPNSSKAMWKELNSAQTDSLLKLPAMQAYLKDSEASRWQIETPKLSLHEVFAGMVPEEFADLDAHKTIVGLQNNSYSNTHYTMKNHRGNL